MTDMSQLRSLDQINKERERLQRRADKQETMILRDSRRIQSQWTTRINRFRSIGNTISKIADLSLFLPNKGKVLKWLIFAKSILQK